MWFWWVQSEHWGKTGDPFISFLFLHFLPLLHEWGSVGLVCLNAKMGTFICSRLESAWVEVCGSVHSREGNDGRTFYCSFLPPLLSSTPPSGPHSYGKKSGQEFTDSLHCFTWCEWGKPLTIYYFSNIQSLSGMSRGPQSPLHSLHIYICYYGQGNLYGILGLNPIRLLYVILTDMYMEKNKKTSTTQPNK